MADSKALFVALRHFKHYQKGFLPVAGGILDQPAFLMACIEVCSAALAEWEALEMQDRRAQMQRQSPASSGKARVLGRLNPEDRGPGWRSRLRPI